MAKDPKKPEASLLVTAIKKPDFDPQLFSIKAPKSSLALQVLMKFEYYFIFFHFIFLLLITFLKGKSKTNANHLK